MNGTPHVLVVDDNQEIRTLLTRFFSEHGLRASTAPDGKGMRKAMQTGAIDLVILDLMLPGEDGLTLCRELRARSSIPVIMLTAIGEETDRIVGLEMGADDYITKPFNPRELLARVKAVLRRSRSMPEKSRPPEETVLTVAGWKFDVRRRHLESADGIIVPLSTVEFNLLLAFVRNPEHVLNRDQLLDLTRGRSATPFDRSVDTQVSRLRRKLGDDPKNPQIIRTVWGEGYVYSEPTAGQ